MELHAHWKKIADDDEIYLCRGGHSHDIRDVFFKEKKY